MRVTAFLPTHDIPEEAMPWMAEVRNIFDGLVIFLDETRITSGTVARAEKVATRVLYHTAETWHDWDRAAMARACDSEWVFLIERDEQLSPEWRQAHWRRILETTQCTHFWILRRWTVPGGRYIRDAPWWPDFQLRLFRNNLEGATFPTKLHEPIHVPGAGASFRSLIIYHHVLTLYSLTERERRVRLYEEMRPGAGAGHYYLYEKYRPSEAPIPEATSLDFDHEIIRMDTLPRERISDISMNVKTAPKEVSISEMFWLDVEVTNTTSEPIYSCPPFPVHLAYHWIRETTRQMVMFEGARSGLFPCAPPNTTTSWKMVVIAPAEPGKYILQTTMVQEWTLWFENIRPEIRQEFVISVTAKK
jgi:hypothetical protein